MALKNIDWIGSPNFSNGRQGNGIQGFVIHWIVGNLKSADSIFQNRQRNTSAHFGVEDDVVHQYVDVRNTAYHAGNWDANLKYIGIEHSAQPGRNASEATYETSAQLIAKIIRENNAGYNLKPHSAFVATACPGTVDVNRIANRVNEILKGTHIPPVVPAPPVATKWAKVTVQALNVRKQPTSKSPLSGSMTLHLNDEFEYTELVQGENVNGVSTWIKSKKGNYVWAGGTDLTTPAVASAPKKGGTAQAIRQSNVRRAPNLTGTLVKQPDGNYYLSPGQTFQYSAKVYGQWVNQNGVNTNVWYHSTKGNYVWAGNLKDV